MEKYTTYSSGIKTTTILIREEELAATASTRPNFGIDIQPVGAEAHNKGRPVDYIVPSIPGTFYDLISPSYSKDDEQAELKLKAEAAERAKKAVGDFSVDKAEDKAEKAKRIQGGGDPKYSFTFKALHTAVVEKLQSIVYQSLPADFRSLKSPELSYEDVNKFFSSSGKFSRMFQYIRVKKVGADFIITLPVAVTSVNQLLATALKDIPYTGYTFDDRKKAVIPDIIAGLKQHGFPITNGGIWNFDIPKAKIAAKLAGRYSKVNDFYAKYVEGYKAYDIDLIDVTKRPSAEQEEPLHDNAALSRNFVLCAVLKLPAKEAEYYVQTSAEKITASLMLTFFSNWYQKGVRGKKKFPTFIHSLNSILTKNASYTPKPRVDKNGIALTRSNYLLYVPGNVNAIKDYTDLIEILTKDDTGEATYSHTSLSKFPTYKLIYVDWVNQKLIYTGQYSQIEVTDIESNHPLPVSAYVSWYSASVAKHIDNLNQLDTLCLKINTSIGANVPKRTSELYTALGEGYAQIIERFLTHVNEPAYRRAFSGSQVSLHDCKLVDYIKGINTFLVLSNMDMARYTTEGLEQGYLDFLNCYPLKMKDMFSKQMLPFAPIQAWIEAIGAAVPNEDDWLKVINESNDTPEYTMGNIALFKIIQAFSNMPDILREYDEANAAYITQDQGLETFIPKLKNAEGLAGLKPHQRKVAGMLAKHPKFAVIAVQAGGGKTILAIQDILNCLEDKTVTKPLVLCPSNLVKDYIAETNYVSHGKVNTIVFDTKIFRDYGYVEKEKESDPSQFDFRRLKALCDNAPINTIFCIGYDSVKTIDPPAGVYGTVTDDFQQKLEFLRSIGFDGVWMDESHRLKNENSARTQAIESLVTEIPVKRLLTGTIVPNTLRDLVSQIAMLAPNILGNEDQFMENFFEPEVDAMGKKRKGPVVPKPGAERQIRDFIKQSCAYVNIQRKEWQAALPKLEERMMYLEMSPAQWEIYDVLIARAIDEMSGQVSDKGDLIVGDGDDEEKINVAEVFENDSLEDDEALERMFDSAAFGKNLSKVEGFLSNPISVPEGNEKLKGDDRVSPKAKAVIHILERHVGINRQRHHESDLEELKGVLRRDDFANNDEREAVQKSIAETEDLIYRIKNPKSKEALERPVYPGKVLIFCNTHAAVNGIWAALPQHLKDMTIKYGVEAKADHERDFKQEDKLRVLIGIRNSLEEGLNLQAADTLIRVDNVWTPGSAEQGMSRINRPNFKGTDFRKEIYVYTLMVDKTIDVLKTAKITSKAVTVAKFYAAGTEDEAKYVGIGLDSDGSQIPPMKVSFENLRMGLGFRELDAYWNAYQKLRQIEADIADEWRAAQPLDSLKDVPIVHTGILPGSKRLKNIPYTAGMDIFNASELGLVPYGAYKRKVIEAGKTFEPYGTRVHTAFGEATLIKEQGRGEASVKLPSGAVVYVPISAMFVITKKTTSTMEILDKIASQTGLEVLDVQLNHWRDSRKKSKAEVEEEKKSTGMKTLRQVKEERLNKVKGPRKDDPRKVVRDAEEDKGEIFQDTSDRALKEIELRAVRVNDMVAVVIPSNDAASDIASFKEFGFQVTPLYKWVRVKTWKLLDTFLDTLQAAKDRKNSNVDIRSQDMQMWNEVLEEFKRNKQFIVTPKTFSNIKNFLMERRRPLESGKVRPMPLVKDHQLFICMDLVQHQRSSASMNKVMLMATKAGMGAWQVEDQDLMAFCSNKAEAKSKMKGLQQDGWTVTNAEQFLIDLDALIARGKKPSDKEVKKPMTALKVKQKDVIKPKKTLRTIVKTKAKK